MASVQEALSHYERLSLTRVPTPLERLQHLSADFGTNLWIKREDLTDLALGGDKPRKLEYELARAVAQGADTVVTCGSAQSNHARLTTAAARRLGLGCALVLSRDAHTVSQGNLLTVRLMGAEVHLVDRDDHWALEADARALCERLRAAGRRPYYVPVSGTTPTSCLGYVRAGLELMAQMRDAGIRPDAVYVPFGTGGICAGLTFALRTAGLDAHVAAVSVNAGSERCVRHLADWWLALAGLLDQDPAPAVGSLDMVDGYIGSGYGDATEACLDAILTMAEREGILLDPVYSGKVAACLFADCARGRWRPGQHVVLLHSGGVPALFAYAAEINAHLARRGRGALDAG